MGLNGMDTPTYELTGRGFKHYEPIETDYGHVLKVYESSRAEGPHLWLEVDMASSVLDTDAGAGKTHVHMSMAQAEALWDTLAAAIANHYQNEG